MMRGGFKVRKILFVLAIVIVASAFSVDCFSKELKIGYVDMPKVVGEYRKTDDYEKVLKNRQTKEQKRLDTKGEEVKKIQDRLSTLKGDAEEKEKERFRKLAQEYYALEREILLSLRKEEYEKKKEITEDIYDVIDEYAKKNKYDLILPKGLTLYTVESMDLTDVVIKLVNKRYKK